MPLSAASFLLSQFLSDGLLGLDLESLSPGTRIRFTKSPLEPLARVE
jgi:hypothetical protein